MYTDARHVFGEMSPWQPCGVAAHHPSCCVSRRPRPNQYGRRGPLAPLLAPTRSQGLLPCLNAGERPRHDMAVAELRPSLPFLLLHSLFISTKRVTNISSSGCPSCAPFLTAAAIVTAIVGGVVGIAAGARGQTTSSRLGPSHGHRWMRLVRGVLPHHSITVNKASTDQNSELRWLLCSKSRQGPGPRIRLNPGV